MTSLIIEILNNLILLSLFRFLVSQFRSAFTLRKYQFLCGKWNFCINDGSGRLSVTSYFPDCISSRSTVFH